MARASYRGADSFPQALSATAHASSSMTKSFRILHELKVGPAVPQISLSFWIREPVSGI